jgi:hypothetical protein
MRGRPKKLNKSKDRVYTISLSEKAALLLQDVRRKRPSFLLGRYVSEHLIRDFNSLEGNVRFLKCQVAENNKLISDLNDENVKLVNGIKRIQEVFVEGDVVNEVYK